MLFDKAAQKKYMIGYDLRDDTCQISYGEMDQVGKMDEPVTVSGIPGTESFDLPLFLCRNRKTGEWIYGEKAREKSSDPSWEFVSNLLLMSMEGEKVTLGGKEYEAVALLARYIGNSLSELPLPDVDSAFVAVMFTSRTMDSRKISLLEEVRKRLNLACHVFYQDYGGSYYDFMLNQPRALREPASALFQYEEGKKLRVSKLIFNLKTKPIVADEEEKEYPGIFAKDQAGRDKELSTILEEELADRSYASVYFIGSGFKGSWMKQSTEVACSGGRRAFAGGNLFSKGAVYAVADKVSPSLITSSYFLLDGNKLRTNILTKVYRNGRQETITLVNAGQNWYEVDESTDLVLESTGEINLILKPITGGEESPFHIRLEGLPVRQGRITRIRLEFSMDSPSKVILLMTDLGFGEIFPSCGLKWKQEITV